MLGWKSIHVSKESNWNSHETVLSGYCTYSGGENNDDNHVHMELGLSILTSDQSLISKGRHDDVIKWKHFPRYWPFVRGIHRSSVNSPHKGQWRGNFMFTLICAQINGWVNNHVAGDLRRYRAHYDVIVMRGCYLYAKRNYVLIK